MKAYENLFLMSHVTILKGAADGDADIISAEK